MGVLFGDTHSDDLGIVHTSTNIGEAEPIIKTLEVPGAINPLDLSEIYGNMLYKARTNVFGFHVIKSRSECLKKFTEVRNLLNGKRLDIIWDEDSDYKYNGRVKVAAYMDKSVGVIEVEAICDPYKLRNAPTVVMFEVVEESKIIELYNECMPVIPTIITDSDFVLEYEGITLMIEAGESRLPDILLKAGQNKITCTGTGSITFTYREGAL